MTDLSACYFYHTMELPGLGVVAGEWDLRQGLAAYLGEVPLAGKRVLEIGTASGYVGFSMELQGAEVVAFDLAPDGTPDLVPYARANLEQRLHDHRSHVERIHNAFWFAHRLLESKARVVYGNVYAIPDAIGPVDVATFGCVLLHLRDPFQTLAQAARLTRETIIVTEPLVTRSRLKRWLLARLGGAALFFPDHQTTRPETTWWVLTPELIQRFLAVLGFERVTITYHHQLFQGKRVPLFTVVGRRTSP